MDLLNEKCLFLQHYMVIDKTTLAVRYSRDLFNELCELFK